MKNVERKKKDIMNYKYGLQMVNYYYNSFVCCYYHDDELSMNEMYQEYKSLNEFEWLSLVIYFSFFLIKHKL